MDTVQIVEEVSSRASEVRKQLATLVTQAEDSFLDVCDLLREVITNKYHLQWGYARFQDWVTNSNLDISPRQAFYCVNIASKIEALGLSREDIKKIKISKLKEILALGTEEHGDFMRQLLKDAPELSIEEIKSRIAELKGKQNTLYMTLKLDASLKEIIKDTFELARRQYGSQVVEREVVDISDTKCMELICASYLQDPNNKPEEE